MGNDHGTNKPEDTNDAEEQRRIDEIKKEENKKAAFQGYLSIKDFFVDYIYGDKTVNNEQGIDRYLISIKSIPHFSKLIAEMSAEKIDNLEQLKNEEKKLKNKLLDYKIENNIKIYNNYEESEKISKDPKLKADNEFIIVDNIFIKNFGLQDQESLNKFITIKKIDKERKLLTILFPDSKKEILAIEIENKQGYFKFMDATIIVPNEIDAVKELAQFNNELLTLIESIFNCLFNVQSFKDLLLKQKQITMTKGKSLLEIILKIIKEKHYDEYKYLIESYNSTKYLNIIDKIYDLFHQEFKIIQNDSYGINDINLRERINNCGNRLPIIINDNKSVISEIFYFINIITFDCDYCYKQSQNEFKNNYIKFNLEEINKYYNSINELNIIDCFDYLTRNQNENITCECMCNSTYSFYRIKSVQKILTIILDRGIDFNDGIKFKVDFDINLTKYFVNSSNQISFELIGLCTYNKNQKKYNSYYKNYVDNLLYYFDGTNDKKISEYDNSTSPLILFYMFKN